MLKKRGEQKVDRREVNELVDLYNTWMGLLLRRLGEGEHRFTQQEFKEGLGRLKLSVRREDGDYILCLTEPTLSCEGKEEAYDGDVQ